MMQSRRYDFVDLLRGFAAVAVLICHYRWFYARYPTDWRTDVELPAYSILWPIYEHGEVAVCLFWILSGFVFAVAYGQHGKGLSVREFAVHRFARLYPLHFATLVIVAALQALSVAETGEPTVYPNNNLPNFLLHLGLASNWLSMESSFNAPIWSVSIEVLIYGLFLVYLKRCGLAFWPAVAIGAAAFLIERLTHNRVALCAALFFGGVLLAKVKPPLWLALLGFTGAVAATALTGSEGAFIYLGTPTLLAVFVALDERYTLAERWHWIGKSTYSVYLLHMPILIALKMAGVIPPLWAFVGLVIALAYPSYRWLEMPAQNFIRSTWRRDLLARPT